MKLKLSERHCGDNSDRVSLVAWRIVSRPYPNIVDLLSFTDAFRSAFIKAIGNNVPTEIIGKDSYGIRLDNHDHCHFLAVPSEDTRHISAFAAWFPSGLAQEYVNIIKLKFNKLFVQRKPQGIGFAQLSFLDEIHVNITDLLDDEPADDFCTITPYVPTKHIKKHQSLNEFLQNNVLDELKIRELQITEFASFNYKPMWPVPFDRKYNQGEVRSYWIRFKLSHHLHSPLIIGKHSHFGYGWFISTKHVEFYFK